MRKFPKLDLNSDWVEKTLGEMTLDQKIGQLLHPCIQPSSSVEHRTEALGSVEPGGLFLFSGSRQEFLEITRWFQDRSPIPLLISADLENGAGNIVEDATRFPSLMGLAATDNAQLAYEMGRAAAVEGRSCGVHWSFGPVVDLCVNPHNPDSNTRSMGDNPDRVASLSQAMIRGMQENGLCATVKHFPGAGFDDRDQHLTNTINPLRMDQWFESSGRMFQEAFELGVWSVMIGHLSLPAWDPGVGEHIQYSPPATLSRRIVTDLLRERMGFDGVIITDALDMAGVTAWGVFDEIIPRVIEAGSDMILFSEAKRDFDILRRAVDDGRLSEERIEESARRILALKETLNLQGDSGSTPVSDEEGEFFQQTSVSIAEKSITLVKDNHNALPLKFEKGVRVLSYHLRGDPEDNVDTFDDLLRQKGAEVVRFTEEDINSIPRGHDFADYDVVLLNIVLKPSWGTNRIRPAGNFMRDVWALITCHHPRLVMISYGSPYMSYEMPFVPLVINAYSNDLNTQKAELRVLSGEIQAKGISPVDLDSPYFTKSLDGFRANLRDNEK